MNGIELSYPWNDKVEMDSLEKIQLKLLKIILQMGICYIINNYQSLSGRMLEYKFWSILHGGRK